MTHDDTIISVDNLILTLKYIGTVVHLARVSIPYEVDR